MRLMMTRPTTRLMYLQIRSQDHSRTNATAKRRRGQCKSQFRSLYLVPTVRQTRRRSGSRLPKRMTTTTTRILARILRPVIAQYPLPGPHVTRIVDAVVDVDVDVDLNSHLRQRDGNNYQNAVPLEDVESSQSTQ